MSWTLQLVIGRTSCGLTTGHVEKNKENCVKHNRKLMGKYERDTHNISHRIYTGFVVLCFVVVKFLKFL